METSKGSLEGRRRAPKLNAGGIISQSAGDNGDSDRARRSRRALSYYNVLDGAVALFIFLTFSIPIIGADLG